VVELYDAWGADRVIAEVNNGGDLVETVLRTVRPELALTKIHAARGKRLRAEPAAALLEQGRVHLVAGQDFADLEAQLSNFDPDRGSRLHDDRVDAFVYALAELCGEAGIYGAPEEEGAAGNEVRWRRRMTRSGSPYRDEGEDGLPSEQEIKREATLMRPNYRKVR
jgi:hypothetical protein